jgi:alkylhydroperoxidase/carboxymuconolactone decarboxylase family protein YurZ
MRWLYHGAYGCGGENGATREEILEALGVAVAVNAGAAPVYSARVMDACTAISAEQQGAGKVLER